MKPKHIVLEDFQDVWDYVSSHTITDDVWFKHLDVFKEITNELYKIDRNSVDLNLFSPEIKIKLIGKNLEVIFSILSKNNLLSPGVWYDTFPVFRDLVTELFKLETIELDLLVPEIRVELLGRKLEVIFSILSKNKLLTT